MSDKLTRLLTETLRSRENDVEPIPGLTARVLEKGRSARNRRLAVGWGATGLVAAVAVAAVVLGPVGRHLPNPGPANSGTPSPSATSSATSTATVTESATEDSLLYAAKLPSGPPIALVPRAEKRGTKVVAVTADHVVTLPTDTAMAYNLTSSTEGLLVTTHGYGFTGGGPDADQALYLIRADGSLTKLHNGPFSGMAVDPSGKQYAIVEIGLGNSDPARITVASLSHPGTTRSHAELPTIYLRGWTTQGLLLEDSRDSGRSWLWQPGGGPAPKIPQGVLYPSVMPTDPGRLLIATGAPGNGFCLHLYTLSSRQLGPVLTCSAGSDLTVSPDGRRAVVGPTVVDLVTGRVGPKLRDRLAFPFAQWEDPTHVLTHVLGNDARGGGRSSPSGSAVTSRPVPVSRHQSRRRTAPRP
jgi:hypothetical protein